MAETDGGSAAPSPPQQRRSFWIPLLTSSESIWDDVSPAGLAQVTAQAALSQSYFNHIQPADEQPQMVNAVNAKWDLDDSQIGSPVDVTEPQQMVSVYADTNDGYNWRKYGQKQVKASENPRSYYKCTYVNCPVKKKVGQSLDGHVTDIVYKGQHNHDPPQPNKRTKEGAHVNKPNNSQLEKPVADHGSNQLMRIDQGFNHLTIDDSDDEPNPKRRNTEVTPVSAPVESTLSNKMVSEPKFVVQTRSEVDLLDDGFKSYYKCTFAGCNVRKHVERARSDLKSVVTTYEGRHNHDIPVSKHRGYINNGGGQMGKSTKPSQHKDTKHGNSERRALLQMKEEAITV
ncbi:hypothetical protein L1987_43978 [Smallanthus sonchifolius]|uniref:Uncharacterized protein n=1 Tax=Smallanthus sonchifolius TaxID=185202 RepID=A0ACB9GPC6_9ASTR|nr:hypothetical protein L1987_43978 [Smallanthus sonchifolius]